MLSLEDRVRTAGSDKDRDDLAAAFVARKAVDDRLQEISGSRRHMTSPPPQRWPINRWSTRWVLRWAQT